MLGDLYDTLNARITGLITFIVSGFIIILISILLLIKYKKTKRLEDLGINDKYEYLEEANIGDKNVVNTILTTNTSR